MRSRFWLLLGLSLVMLMALAGNVLAQDMTGDFEVVQAAAQAYLSSDKPPTMSADALWENLSDGDPDNDPFILSVRSPVKITRLPFSYSTTSVPSLTLSKSNSSPSRGTT